MSSRFGADVCNQTKTTRRRWLAKLRECRSFLKGRRSFETFRGGGNNYWGRVDWKTTNEFYGMQGFIQKGLPGTLREIIHCQESGDARLENHFIFIVALLKSKKEGK